jgi:60 kDa SS-A/Ro ribonucleoprotein
MKGYMINVASNKNGVGYGQWLHIDGWSDKVLDYIVKYESANE